jgi:beta-mannanase
MKFGIYQPSTLLDTSVLSSLEDEYGADISILSFYRAWNYCAIENDLEWLYNILSVSREIMLTWEPWHILPETSPPEDQSEFSLRKISSGIYDAYIHAFALILARSRKIVFLRLMHEMNGFWYPWCGTVNNNHPEEYIEAWKHIRSVFARASATNVKWVWSPYVSSYPNTPENSIITYFPGNDNIDIIALDGYNWGTSSELSIWQSFLEIFDEAYGTVTSISSKPVIIAETGCSECGGNKADWINEMFFILQSRFKQIKAFIWFDVNKESDWLIASSASALQAFKKNAQSVFAGQDL